MSVVNLGIDHDSDEVVALKATISTKSTVSSHLDVIPLGLTNVSRQSNYDAQGSFGAGSSAECGCRCNAEGDQP